MVNAANMMKQKGELIDMEVTATESGFNQTVRKDQATLIAELISRVTSLEDTVEFILEQSQKNMIENTNELQSKVELKPCPFCNGNAEVKNRYRKGVANRKMYWVECKKCGVSQAHHELAGYRTPNKAIAVWNHRW